MTNDSYLSSISPESRELIDHFGPEAPVKLNTYACNLEDALLESLDNQQIQQHELLQCRERLAQLEAQMEETKREREVMKTILAEPEQLLAYVRWFFGPDGTCPGEAVISRCHRNTAAR